MHELSLPQITVISGSLSCTHALSGVRSHYSYTHMLPTLLCVCVYTAIIIITLYALAWWPGK